MEEKIESQVLLNRMTPQLKKSERKLTFSASAPMGWTLGTDVSHWQGIIDWNKMASKNVKFSITKGTDFYRNIATGFVDKRAEINLEGMREAGIRTGGYCWLQPRHDPKLQAQYFLDNFYSKHKTAFPPVLDFEDNNVISWSDMLWRAQVWLEVVEEQTGEIPIVYTSPGYMMNFDKNKSGFLSRYPLWIAHYIQRTYPTVPYPWQDWMIWQYSHKGHFPYYDYDDLNGKGHSYGVSSYGLDMNWYKGTEEELDEQLGEEHVPPTPPDPEPEPEPLFFAKVIAWRLNVRSGVGTVYPIITGEGLTKGDIVPVYEIDRGWYRIGENKWISGSWAQKIVEPMPEPEPEPNDKLFTAECIAWKLYTRSGPAITYDAVGDGLIQGDKVDVYEIRNGWYRIKPDKQVWVSGLWMKKL